MPELSIVIPCLNEEENVRAICAAVTAEATTHAASHEIILIDNFSTDNTRAIILELCREDPRIRAIFNNRNYGQMRSPTHGIYQASGDAVIGMCADFQDPPEMIGEFMRLWRGGAKVVLGQRRSEPAGAFTRTVRNTGYAILGRIADYPIIPNATGFGLFDHAVVETLKRWNEPEPFFRGMVVESGFPLALVPFDRPARQAGETKNGPLALLSFALSGLAGSAKALLRMPILIGGWFGLLAVPTATLAVCAAFLGGPAWYLAALAFLLLVFGGLFLFLGLLGDQVRLLTERARGVPLVIEETRINFPPGRLSS